MAFRHIHPAMAQMETPQFPEFGEANKPRVIEFLQHLDSELGKRRYVAGTRSRLPNNGSHCMRFHEAGADSPV